jgi:hypothetical protein
MQKSAALHHSRSIPSAIHSLTGTPQFDTACAPPPGSSCGGPEARVSVVNAHSLISKCSPISLELSNVVVNLMTKDHTVESSTHRIAAIWLTRIREGRMSTSICLRTSDHGRAESWRVCYRPTVDGLDRSKSHKPPRERRRGPIRNLWAPQPRETARAGDRLAWTVTRRPSPIKAWRRNRRPGQSDCRKAPGERRKKKDGGIHEGRPHGPTHASRGGHPKGCYPFEYDNRRFNAE